VNRTSRIYVCVGVLAILCTADRVLQRYVDARIAAPAERAADPLEGVPFLLGDWYGRTISIERTAANSDPASEFLRRDYSDSRGETVALYIASYDGYHRNIPHGPSVCYPMSGWNLLDERRLANSDGTDDCTMYVFSRELDKQLVLYWHEVDGVRMAGPTFTRLRFARGLLAGRPGRIVQVQLATTIGDEGIQPALDRLNSFRTRLEAASGDALTGHVTQAPGGDR